MDPLDADIAHVWHPFTQMSEWDREAALVIREGEGAWLVDTTGRRYLDGVSSLWCNVHGHRVPAIDAAILGQLGRVAHSTLLGLGSEPAARFAEGLVAAAPRGLTRVVFSDSGSTAVEVALKIAFQYFRQRRRDPRPEKTRFLALTNGYHGDTLGAVSVGGIGLFHEVFRPLTFPAHFAPSPYCYRCPLGLARETCGIECIEELRKVLDAHGSEIAAVILEPAMQCAGGMIPIPEGYLRRLRDLTRERDVLLIADEVAVGFGRTGRLFACEHEGVTPDLLCLGKGITGGYLPVAATLATEEIYRAFLGRHEELRTFFHGHTYGGNALGCAAGLASLQLFEEARVLERLRPKIASLSALLGRFRAHPHVGDVRQAGFIAGIELVRDWATKEPLPPGARVGHRICMAARGRGAILRPLGNVLVLFPPLSISGGELDLLMSILWESLCEILPPA